LRAIEQTRGAGAESWCRDWGMPAGPQRSRQRSRRGAAPLSSLFLQWEGVRRRLDVSILCTRFRRLWSSPHCWPSHWVVSCKRAQRSHIWLWLLISAPNKPMSAATQQLNKVTQRQVMQQEYRKLGSSPFTKYGNTSFLTWSAFSSTSDPGDPETSSDARGSSLRRRSTKNNQTLEAS